MTQTDSIEVSPITATQVQAADNAVTVADTMSAAPKEVSAAPKEEVARRPAAGIVSLPAVPADSLSSSETLGSDTIKKADRYGITLKGPVVPEVVANETDSFGLSIVTGGVILLFCVIGIRFHNNSKYITTMLRNLIDVRVRTNVFDDTVRETSFMVLLNFLWSCSAGILLYGLLCATVPDNPAASFGISGLHTHPALSMAICIGVGIVYTCFMAVAYFMVGTVFAGKIKARLWLKGYTAGQGFLSFVYFFLALLLISHPEWGVGILWVAAGWLILAKIVFIWKGFRIFFTQISSWVLFLYYLCSLEIVPLILTYLAAILLCGFLL